MDNFLIDECLTTELVAEAKARGLQATHVHFLGKGGARDHTLRDLAIARNFVFVTNNRIDFLKLYISCEMHCGLIIFAHQVNLMTQKILFNNVLDMIGIWMENPVSKLIEIELSGNMHIREWSRENHDISHISNPNWSL